MVIVKLKIRNYDRKKEKMRKETREKIITDRKGRERENEEQ